MDEQNTQNNTPSQNLKTLRTYSSDMADAVRENEASVIKIALAEQKKHEREDIYRQAEGTPLSKILLIFGGIILLVGGSVGAYYLFDHNTKANAPVAAVQTQIDTFISYDDMSYVDASKVLSNTDLSQLLTDEVKKNTKPGNLHAIFLTTTKDGKPSFYGQKDFFALLGSTAPEQLARSWSDSYLVGSYTPTTTGSTPHLFMMFKTKNYASSYAGMLGWEKTMLDDVYTFFGVDVSGDRQALFKKGFKDVTLNNRDARLLYDAQGSDVLYYIFINKDYCIVTDNTDTIKELNTRILTKNTKPL